MEDGMDMEGEKDMNRKCVKQNVVVNVMRKIIMVMVLALSPSNL